MSDREAQGWGVSGGHGGGGLMCGMLSSGYGDKVQGEKWL